MDEIDAALDYKNVSIVGNYIQERTQNAQFIVISLRNNMFELSNQLVGVYKTFNTTKTITICPKQIASKIEQTNIEKRRRQLEEKVKAKQEFERRNAAQQEMQAMEQNIIYGQ
jgi:hypothetical protein